MTANTRRRKPPTTDVEAWLAIMGRSRHQLAVSVPLIGLNAGQAEARNNRAHPTQWSKAEKMAMTAAWLGLPAFSIDLYNLPADKRAAILEHAAAIREAMGISESAPGPDEAPPQ